MLQTELVPLYISWLVCLFFLSLQECLQVVEGLFFFSASNSIIHVKWMICFTRDEASKPTLALEYTFGRRARGHSTVSEADSLLQRHTRGQSLSRSTLIVEGEIFQPFFPAFPLQAERHRPPVGAGRRDVSVRPGPDPNNSSQRQVGHLHTSLLCWCSRERPRLPPAVETWPLLALWQVPLCRAGPGPVQTQHPVGHHGEAAAGGSNSGGKSLFQETAGGQTANAPPTKRLSSEESSEHTTSIHSCFNIGIVFTFLKVSKYATFDGEVLVKSNISPLFSSSASSESWCSHRVLPSRGRSNRTVRTERVWWWCLEHHEQQSE